jgi:hypothetical protein
MNLSRFLSKPLSWWMQTPIYAGRVIGRRLRLDERLNSILSPPTSQQKQLISQLRSKFPAPASAPIESSSTAKNEWTQNCETLRHEVMGSDPRGFLRWSVVKNTMFAPDAPYIAVELDFLRGLPDWSTRWSDLIEEDQIGRPVRSFYEPRSSANRIHHAYHIARFEEVVGDINRFDAVLEFGAGYGNFRRLWSVLSPQARYLLFDFPEWGALQNYYLKHFSLSAVFSSDPHEGARFVAEAKNPLFVAMWSLSESPLADRAWVEEILESFGAVLIAFQWGFGEVDNLRYFEEWGERFPCFHWTTSPIPHLPNNYYIMGNRR